MASAICHAVQSAVVLDAAVVGGLTKEEEEEATFTMAKPRAMHVSILVVLMRFGSLKACRSRQARRV